MININNTPIIKDASDLKAPYINTYNQVFIQNEKVKLIIHHEIYPIYIGDSKKDTSIVIPNEAILYFIVNNNNNKIINCYHSFYQALCEFNKLK